ncbi:MAG: hypothetical protein U5N86_04730 [Planctomycetota bacterium]|nr:hypothetical protein [Planctomycetota bacterium]
MSYDNADQLTNELSTGNYGNYNASFGYNSRGLLTNETRTTFMPTTITFSYDGCEPHSRDKASERVVPVIAVANHHQNDLTWVPGTGACRTARLKHANGGYLRQRLLITVSTI